MVTNFYTICRKKCAQKKVSHASQRFFQVFTFTSKGVSPAAWGSAARSSRDGSSKGSCHQSPQNPVYILQLQHRPLKIIKCQVSSQGKHWHSSLHCTISAKIMFFNNNFIRLEVKWFYSQPCWKTSGQLSSKYTPYTIAILVTKDSELVYKQ